MTIEQSKFIIIGSTGKEYTITLNNNGGVECDCLGFVNYEKCYHSSYITNCLANKISPKNRIKRSIKIFS